MKGSINETLKTKLIVKPSPKYNKTEFIQLYNRICSCPDKIIAFLDAEDTGKKTKIAQEIIDIMVLESNFPPTSRMLNFLAEFEQSVRYSRTIENKSRDHYIHMCYLYFLGVYLFFYHQEFNEKLHSVLTLIKQSNEISEESNFVKSFISAWKYFVLYHDIAYPFEYLGDEEHDYNKIELDKKKIVEEIFTSDGIYKEVIKQLSLKIMGTLIAIYNVIKKSTFKSASLSRYLGKNINNYRETKQTEDLTEVLKVMEEKEIFFLQYIKDGEDIKFFYTVFDRDDFIILLKRKSNIECIIYKEKLYILEGLKKRNYIRNIQSDINVIFSDEFQLKFPELKVEYYGVDLRSKLSTFLNDNTIGENYFKQFEFSTKKAKNMKEFVRECYFDCFSKINVDKKFVLKDLEEEIRKKIFYNIQNKVVIEKDEKKFDISQTSYAELYTKKYLSAVQNILPEVSSKMIDEIALGSIKEIMQENDIRNEMQRVISNIIGSFSIVKCNIKINDVWKEYNVENSISEIENSFETVVAYLESALREAIGALNASTLTDMLKSYNLSYSKYDHGIVAAFVYLKYFYIYQKIIDENQKNVLLRVGLNIPFFKDEKIQEKYIQEKYVDDYTEMIGQVTYAILIHNLYPDNFPDISRIRTNIVDNSFAYFCMVCDMLQNWGRPYNINSIKECVPMYMDAKEYNISVGNYILITFSEDNPAKIIERLKSFGEELDSYLSDASGMIKTNFGKE